MKLVIITHPNINSSKINLSWAKAAEQYSDTFDIEYLYTKYPNLDYNIEEEQMLLKQYDEIIFQFPIHWFSTPFALKKYIDEVFTYGWAFGPGGTQMQGKKISLAVSTGGIEENYTLEKGIPISELLNDVALTFKFCGCDIVHIHTFFGANSNPSDNDIKANTKQYLEAFLQ